MQIIPVGDVPSQSFNINLAGQQCQIAISTMTTGLYCSVQINNSLILGETYCANQARIIQNVYLGFQGDLVWIDTQGDSDPSSPGLGTRYLFYYLTVSDLAQLSL